MEDFLEKHLDTLEKGLILIGRQYPTLTGPIDLLAKDAKGNYVVVELKKGRASDRVIGQTLRYMAHIKENLAIRKTVRAIIVGRMIDNKLIMASRAYDIHLHLYEFDYKVNFKRIL